MGIKGLSQYIKVNSSWILLDYELKNTEVVIDGKNFVRFLYQQYKIPLSYGGDYDVYARAVKHFFGVLQQCQVTPVVVLEGPYQTQDDRMKPAKERAERRIEPALKMTPDEDRFLIPLLCVNVFTSVLIEMGIKCLLCDGNADSETASLAKRMGCPVMSHDSDYAIFDLPEGFIFSDDMDLNDVISNFWSSEELSLDHIAVRMFKRDVLLSKFPGLSMEMMPLFALMCGSHRFDASLLSGFLHREHIFPATWRTMSRKERQAAKLEMKTAMLRWLRKRDSLQDAVDDIICNMKPENQSDTSHNIWKGIRWYTEKPFQLFDLMGGLAEGEINFTGTSAFPRWFNADGRTGKLDALILNAAVSQTTILQSQPEHDSTSANRYAEGLRSVIYGIIHESNKVIEFDRLDDKQTTFEVIPCQNLVGEVLVPHITDVQSLSSAQQKNVLYSALGLTNKELLENLENQPEDLQLYLGTIIYWCRCEKQEHHVSALMLCIIKLCIQSLLQKDDTVPARSICHDISTCCSDADLQAISEAFKVVSTPEGDELDMPILHGLSQLQACLQASQALNQLLRCPLPRIQLGHVYSGSLIYSLCGQLQSESEPDAYIRDLLGGSTELEKILKNLRKMIVNKY